MTAKPFAVGGDIPADITGDDGLSRPRRGGDTGQLASAEEVRDEPVLSGSRVDVTVQGKVQSGSGNGVHAADLAGHARARQQRLKVSTSARRLSCSRPIVTSSKISCL
ncbi:MAG: hypothetical protein WA441_02620 [Methyloceanibacter sp.]